MVPRSYEFICKSCGKTVTESAEAEVCTACTMSPMGAPTRPPLLPPPPVQKTPPPAGAPGVKRGGFSVTIKSASQCDFCGGKGTVGSRPCPKCGRKK